MSDILKLRIAMEQMREAWQAAVNHAASAPTPGARVGFDVKAERLLRQYLAAHQAYRCAIIQAAADQEKHDPEGIQSDTQAFATLCP